MQEFYINKNSTLPLLKLELINDGRNDYGVFHEMIQNAEIKFSMFDLETGVYKIINSDATILPKEDICGEEYYIVYKWNERDTKKKGKYKGTFTITFSEVMGGGILIVPIQDELIIYIQ